MPSIVGRALLIDKLVMNPGLSYVRITLSYIKYRAENHVIPTSQEPCFNKFRKMTLNMFNQHAINCR